MFGANSITGLGPDKVVLRCLAPIQSLDWAWMGLFCAAWRQSSHSTRRGWGCPTLHGANPVTGLGMAGALARCLAAMQSLGLGLDGAALRFSAQIQSLDLAWLKLLYADWHQSNHWTGPGWGCCTLLGPNPVIGQGLAAAVVRCLAPIQSLDWAWIVLSCAAWRQSNHWIGLDGAFCVAWLQSSHWTRRGWGCSTLPGANPVTGLGLAGALARCVAAMQSLDWAWMGLFYVARRQSSHWSWPG